MLCTITCKKNEAKTSIKTSINLKNQDSAVIMSWKQMVDILTELFKKKKEKENS